MINSSATHILHDTYFAVDMLLKGAVNGLTQAKYSKEQYLPLLGLNQELTFLSTWHATLQLETIFNNLLLIKICYC